VWTIAAEEETTVSIAWETSVALESQQKICFEIDGDPYYASLQKGRSTDPLISGYALTAGVHTITIHTVGAPLEREALVDEKLSLILKKE